MASAYPFNKVLEVMKPNKINDTNRSDVAKLQSILNSPQYIAEEKLDGCHYLCINGRFFSTHISVKTGLPVEKTANFPHLTVAIESLMFKKIVLDGEIYYPDGRSQDVQSATGSSEDVAIKYQKKHGWVEYRIFDILRAPDGTWLLDKTWEQRRAILDSIAPLLKEASPYLVVNPYVAHGKEKFLKEILAAGKEGIVLKRRDSLYQPGKRPKWEWMKIKQSDEDDVVIMGFAPPKKEYSGTNYENHPYWIDGEPVSKYHYLGQIGSIIFGKYKDGKLIEAGQCSGMSDSERAMFSETPEAFIGTVIKIKFMEKTNDGKHRHATFVAIHPDKNAEECIIE